MGRKGLDNTFILQEAVVLIAEQGIKNFSLRALARKLNIKSSSLYNHFNSLDELLTIIAQYVMQEMNRSLYEAIESKTRDDAVAALFNAYRLYVQAHPEIYRVVLSLNQADSKGVDMAASQITGPVNKVLAFYKLTPELNIHCQRYLRSLMHGFISLESQNYLSHLQPPTISSYNFIINSAINLLHRLETEGDIYEHPAK